jgi:hypothetical protein
MLRNRVFAALAVLGLIAASVAPAAESALDSLKSGDPMLASAGALTFGPDGILFVGDIKGASVFAIDTGDRTPGGNGAPKVANLDQKIASLLGIEASQLAINDLAVNPISGNVYLSVTRGKGPDGKPAIIKVDRTGKVGELSLQGVKFAQAKLPNPATGQRQKQDVITDMAYTKGQLIVAGLSNEEFASTLRVIPFPFKEVDKGAGVEIFHGSHNKVETASPIRTFVPYDLAGETHLLAAYTCTPLVKVPVAALKPGQKVKGTTIAELGNRNRPLDMIVYTKGGKDYILMANSARGVMKIPTEGADKAAPITTRVPDKAGLKYETIDALKGVVHLDKLDKEHAVILRTGSDGTTLETIELP